MMKNIHSSIIFVHFVLFNTCLIVGFILGAWIGIALFLP